MKALPVVTEIPVVTAILAENDVTSFSLAVAKKTQSDEIVANLSEVQLHEGVCDSMIRGVAAYNDFRHLVAEVKFRLNEKLTVGGCTTFKDYVEKYLTAKIESVETALRRAYRQIEDLNVKKEGGGGRPKSKTPAPKSNAHIISESTVRDLETKLEKAEAKIEKFKQVAAEVDDAFAYYVLRNELNDEYLCASGQAIPNRKKLKYAYAFFTEENALVKCTDANQSPYNNYAV